jgi:hypothetical protein
MVRGRAVTCRTIGIHDTAIAVACPKCKTCSKFWRDRNPQVDRCGFETYSFRCDACGTSFAGLVDPISDELLVSLSEPASGVTLRKRKE